MPRSLPGLVSVSLFALSSCGSDDALIVSAPPPPTVTLAADPPSILRGASATLTWRTTGASSCTASGGWEGTKVLAASEVVLPLVETIYTLTCEGQAESASRSVTVSVRQPSTRPTVSLTANPATIASGDSSTLEWAATDATTCIASDGWSGTRATSGSQSVSPEATTTYTLACTGPGGEITESASVSVTAPPPPPPPLFEADARVQTVGEVEVRASGSGSGGLLGVQPPGSPGRVVGGPTPDGDDLWWQIAYDSGLDGWTLEEGLEPFPYPASESSGGWRSLVSRNVTPSVAQRAEILARTGIDWDLLRIAEDYSEALAPSDVLVIRNGWIAGEWGTAAPQLVASATKSLTGLAIAKLLDLSDAGGLSRPIGLQSLAYQYLPSAFGASDPLKQQIRLEHLLTMSSGIRPADPDDLALEERLAYPMDAAPGTEWVYSSLPPNLLSVIAQGLSGQTLASFFNTQIASRTGTAPLAWEQLDGGYTRGSDGVETTARDLARIAYLMLQGGVWDDGSGPEQIVTAARIAQFTSPAPLLATTTFRDSPGSPFPVLPDAPNHYGYLWWTNATQVALGASVPPDAYFMHGCRDDLVVVVPSSNLIVVRLADSGPFCTEPTFPSGFMERVMASLVDP